MTAFLTSSCLSGVAIGELDVREEECVGQAEVATGEPVFTSCGEERRQPTRSPLRQSAEFEREDVTAGVWRTRPLPTKLSWRTHSSLPPSPCSGHSSQPRGQSPPGFFLREVSSCLAHVTGTTLTPFTISYSRLLKSSSSPSHSFRPCFSSTQKWRQLRYALFTVVSAHALT